MDILGTLLARPVEKVSILLAFDHKDDGIRQGEEEGSKGDPFTIYGKEENRRPQHFLFPLRWRERETKKPCLDTLDALILCDLL